MRESISPEAQSLIYQAKDDFFAGEWGYAISSLRKVIELGDKNDDIARDWTYVAAHRGLGLAQAQLGNFGGAVKYLERALSLGAERDAALCHALGCSYHIEGRYEEARETLREAISLNENDTLARYFLGMSCIEIGVRQNNYELLKEAEEQIKSLENIAPHLANEIRMWLQWRIKR